MKLSTRLIALVATIRQTATLFKPSDLVVYNDLFKPQDCPRRLMAVIDITEENFMEYVIGSVSRTVPTPCSKIAWYDPERGGHETSVVPNYMLRLATDEEIQTLDRAARNEAADVIGNRRQNYGNARWLLETSPEDITAPASREPVLAILPEGSDREEVTFDTLAERMIDRMDLYKDFTKKARKACKDVRKQIKAGTRVHDGDVPEVVPFPDDNHTVLVYSRGVLTDGAVVEDVMVHQPGNQSWFDTAHFVQLSVARFCIHEEWEILHFMNIDC